jgi:hypothetical protein
VRIEHKGHVEEGRLLQRKCTESEEDRQQKDGVIETKGEENFVKIVTVNDTKYKRTNRSMSAAFSNRRPPITLVREANAGLKQAM